MKSLIEALLNDPFGVSKANGRIFLDIYEDAIKVFDGVSVELGP